MNNKVSRTTNIKEIIPDERVWEYDGDGTKIYKLDQGYNRKTVYTKEHYLNVHFWKGRQ